jgi:hypothetical protein
VFLQNLFVRSPLRRPDAFYFVFCVSGFPGAERRTAGRHLSALGFERSNEMLEALGIVAKAFGPTGRELAKILARVVTRHRVKGFLNAASGLRDLCGATTGRVHVRGEH